MQEIKKEITKEQYDHYAKLDYRTFCKEVKKDIPLSWACGYGWYGARIFKDKDDTCYIIHSIGNSCD